MHQNFLNFVHHEDVRGFERCLHRASKAVSYCMFVKTVASNTDFVLHLTQALRDYVGFKFYKLFICLCDVNMWTEKN